MLKGMLNSSFWMLFYGFFIVSFLPYFFIRFGDQSWVYEILYRPNGIVENMTVVLYVLCVALSGWVFYSCKSRQVTLLIALGVSIFMLGEEVRWGLQFILDDMHDVYITGVQDILFYAARGAPANYPSYLVVGLFAVRIALLLLLAAGCVYVWYHRHKTHDICAKIKAYPYAPFLIVYGVLMSGVIVLELFLQPTALKLDYIEETFELNAALVWLALCIDVGGVLLSQKRANILS